MEIKQSLAIPNIINVQYQLYPTMDNNYIIFNNDQEDNKLYIFDIAFNSYSYFDFPNNIVIENIKNLNKNEVIISSSKGLPIS